MELLLIEGGSVALKEYLPLSMDTGHHTRYTYVLCKKDEFCLLQLDEQIGIQQNRQPTKIFHTLEC